MRTGCPLREVACRLGRFHHKKCFLKKGWDLDVVAYSVLVDEYVELRFQSAFNFNRGAGQFSKGSSNPITPRGEGPHGCSAETSDLELLCDLCHGLVTVSAPGAAGSTCTVHSTPCERTVLETTVRVSLRSRAFTCCA